MKKIILIWIMIVTSLLSSSVKQYKDELKHLDGSQLFVMLEIATKVKGTSAMIRESFIAIAYKESRLGKYKLNLADPSAGIFHKRLDILAKEIGIPVNEWNKSRLAEKLVEDDSYSFDIFINDFQKNLEYWVSKGFKNEEAWNRAIMSYNGGISGWYNGLNYFREIKKIIKALKEVYP